MMVMLIVLGMLMALLGLVVGIPLVGHASWHAYRDLQAGAGRRVDG